MQSDIRLVGGSSLVEGRLEVFYNGVWGTICDEGWDDIDRLVVCKQLGFPVATSDTPSYPAASALQQIWLRDVGCAPGDERLTDCVTNDQWGDTVTCSHQRDVTIRCSGLNLNIAPNYVGCFDFSSISGITRSVDLGSTTAIEDCLESCSDDSTHAAVAGENCFCADNFMSSSGAMPDQMCSSPCPGNQGQLCGGGSAYLSTFTGNYVVDPDVEASDVVVDSVDVKTSGELTVTILALELAPGDSVVIEAGGSTLAIDSGATYMRESIFSNVPSTTTLTVTLRKAANSPGASGFLITYNQLTTTTPDPAQMSTQEAFTTRTSGSNPTNPSSTPPGSATTKAPTTQMGNPALTLTSTTAPQQHGLGAHFYADDTQLYLTFDPKVGGVEECTTAAVGAAIEEIRCLSSSSIKRLQAVQNAAAHLLTGTKKFDRISPILLVCNHPNLNVGTIFEEERNRYSVGDTLVQSCPSGHTPEGNTTLTCRTVGDWQPTPGCETTAFTLQVWLVATIAAAIAVFLIILIIIFCVGHAMLGSPRKRENILRESGDGPITSLSTVRQTDNNDYNAGPTLIPITEDAAAGRNSSATYAPSNPSTPSQPEEPPAPTSPTSVSNDATQQTEPMEITVTPPPEPPSPTESYPPRDYPGALRNSVITNGLTSAQSNGQINHLGNEERRAVDALFNAVRDYDDPPSPSPTGLYGSVPPRHMRSPSVISNPGRVTDSVPSSPWYRV
ncbi:uncharacterized protein [Diadema setosum]|uniref:uncharacterized protein n=1 Tax=Diadema setosum TaxID=31175 RepID=UPI003B3B5BD2